MKISSATGAVFKKFGYEKGLDMFFEAGFRCLDFSFHAPGVESEELFENDETIYKIKEKADSLGIEFNQSHAPFPSYKAGEDEYNAETMKRIIRSVELSGILGCDSIIVHPYKIDRYDELFCENVKFYSTLLPYAEKANVKVAAENMWVTDSKRGYIAPCGFSFSEQMLKLHETINSPWLTLCLDLGHSSLVGREPQDEIYALSGKLCALHVHDTDYKKDLHTLCYIGNQMWDEIARALAETNYPGDFTFEVGFFSRFPEKPMVSALKFMLEIGKYVVDEIENYKLKGDE